MLHVFVRGILMPNINELLREKTVIKTTQIFVIRFNRNITAILSMITQKIVLELLPSKLKIERILAFFTAVILPLFLIVVMEDSSMLDSTKTNNLILGNINQNAFIN